MIERALKSGLNYLLRDFLHNSLNAHASPDGPKVGTISLSPRADWRMPSDSDFEVWLRELE